MRRTLHRTLRRSRRVVLSRRAWQMRLPFFGGAVLVGALAAVFALLSELAHALQRDYIERAPGLILLAAPAGLTLAAWLTRRFAPGSEGSGIPQAIAAVERSGHHLRPRLLSFRIAAAKIALATLGLLSGASIGREGPTVHVGASVMYALGRRLRIREHKLEQGLIIAGGAAGIAAAFNTPLAGALFAVEEMTRSVEERTSGLAIAAVVFAGLTAMAVLGNYTYFGSTAAVLTLGRDWLVVPAAGILGGLLGGFFSEALQRTTAAAFPLARRRPLATAALCGLVVAVLGLASGGTTYGTGYTEAKGLITGTAEVHPAFPLLKALATLTSYLSGIPGGIFAPSLAIGAGLGADLAAWFPHTAPQAVVLLGMAGFFTGVVQTPITAFVIIMEMTDSHEMLLPLMATALLAHGTAGLVTREPLYRGLARQFLHRDTVRSDR